jgi:iron complex outermembrane receptor protein
LPLSDRIDGRGLLSAFVTLDMGDWQVTAYGTNLTNKDYVSGQFNSNELYGAPREYGVRVKVAF